MLISTTTGTLSKIYGEEKAIIMLANAGFDAMDYSMFIHDAETGVYNTDGFAEHAQRLRTVADAAGIKFGQIHAQIPRPSVPDYLSRTELWDKLAVRAIQTAVILDCPYVVVHPLIMPDRRYDRLYRENFNLNLEYYGKMQPAVKEYGVKVAIENMWHSDDVTGEICPSVCSSAEELLAMCDALGEGFEVCLDVGHAILTDRTPESMVYKLGDKLKALHVHDNDGYDDTHEIPFNGLPIYMNSQKPDRFINWEPFMKSLKDIGYSGTFSLEADNFAAKFPKELAYDATFFMARVARYLVDKYEL